MRADEGGVPLQRGLTVFDADAASIVEARDVRPVLALVGVDDAAGREARRSAVGVMNNDDIADPE
jgi:hypothetical protein